VSIPVPPAVFRDRGGRNGRRQRSPQLADPAPWWLDLVAQQQFLGPTDRMFGLATSVDHLLMVRPV